MSVTDVVLPLLGGALIGAAAVAFMALNGRIMGVSGIVSGLLVGAGGAAWRLAFIAGTIAAPLLLALAGFPVAVEIEAGPALLIAAGLLVGFGTALGSGCTSGHGVCGVARLSPRSLAATAVFVAVGMLTVTILRHVL